LRRSSTLRSAALGPADGTGKIGSSISSPKPRPRWTDAFVVYVTPPPTLKSDKPQFSIGLPGEDI
jgi:hypothetical protein